MSFRGYFLLLMALLGGLARPGRAQNFTPRAAVPPDSLHAALEVLPQQADSLRQRFDQERLILRLQAYSRRKTIAGKALSALFNFTKRQEEQAGLDAVLLDRQFDRHNFKIVRRINISTLDAFGYSLTDTTRLPRTFWEKSGNALHIKTSRSRIRQVLLFRPGQPLEPQALAESERLLRQTPEILDARVLVNEATTTRDSVDIDVLTTDVFSITAGLEVGSPTSGLVTLGDQNFLGLGHQIDNAYRYGLEYGPDGGTPQTWSYQGSYTAPFRNFVYAQARYRNEYNYRAGGVSLQRDFYSPSARYAGALNYNAVDQNIALVTPPPGQPYAYYPLRYTVQDAWVGRALRLRSYDLGYENPGRVIVSTRFIRTNYSAIPHPDASAMPNYVNAYNDAVVFLGTVGYSVRRYYKDRYLFGFGRTEDVPTGTLLSFTAGYDVNSVVPRRYLDVRLAAAAFSTRTGYLYASADLGAYQKLDASRDWDQGLFSAELTSFTKLYHFGNWQYRHFFGSKATIGFDRRPGELLQGITNDRGLRGFSPATPILATSRFVLNYETTLFTPLSLLGFRLAGLAFADAAWVGNQPRGGTPFVGAPYTGFGLGLRFRNEFTALRTFQLLIGYYPRGINAANGIRMFETSRETVTFTDFGLGAPGTGQYQ